MTGPLRANADVVWRLHLRLIEAYEGFAQEEAERNPAGLEYLDGLMGFHNAYKRLILDLEERTEDRKRLIRRVAVDTLRAALGV